MSHTQKCFHCEVIDGLRRGIEPAPRDIRTAEAQGCTCPEPEPETDGGWREVRADALDRLSPPNTPTLDYLAARAEVRRILREGARPWAERAVPWADFSYTEITDRIRSLEAQVADLKEEIEAIKNLP